MSTSTLGVPDVLHHARLTGIGGYRPAQVVPNSEIVGPINDLMPDFDAVVLTQDWHPHDHTSFAANHPGAAPFSQVQMPYGPQVLWPAHCVIGTPGAGVSTVGTGPGGAFDAGARLDVSRQVQVSAALPNESGARQE